MDWALIDYIVLYSSCANSDLKCSQYKVLFCESDMMFVLLISSVYYKQPLEYTDVIQEELTLFLANLVASI